jgi:phosphopantothenoylcysteine decarboxylase/phosphopantothenate--cysteine ligase
VGDPDPGAASPQAELSGRTIVLCVTGSIAAYKAVEVARLLLKAGASVLPVMTASGARFVGPVTLAGVCGEAVVTDMWDPAFPGEMHVHLADRADLVAIVPATADVLARLAQGRADDLVTALALCARGRIVAAPAMHPRMWEHPATQRNVADLVAQRRVSFVGPVRGEVASGDVGMGRMAEPSAIVASVAAALASASGSASGRDAAGRPVDLDGLRVVVTAGPTLEDIDPVRFIGNRSSGKMGFALAERAAARGANVTLVAGPVNLATPGLTSPGGRGRIDRVDVRSALEMRAALWEALGQDLSRADVLVMAAAVADHRPADPSATKIKKGTQGPAIGLVENPDLLREVGLARGARRPILVGFAVETAGGDALVAYARRKLDEKRVDIVVANEASDSFGREDNRAVLVTSAGSEALPTASKLSLADVILDRARTLL